MVGRGSGGSARAGGSPMLSKMATGRGAGPSQWPACCPNLSPSTAVLASRTCTQQKHSLTARSDHTTGRVPTRARGATGTRARTHTH
eukprot:8447621-Alexandrium_andersonii.AAC.1